VILLFLTVQYYCFLSAASNYQADHSDRDPIMPASANMIITASRESSRGIFS
jgi:hypothetical protein